LDIIHSTVGVVILAGGSNTRYGEEVKSACDIGLPSGLSIMHTIARRLASICNIGKNDYPFKATFAYAS